MPEREPLPALNPYMEEFWQAAPRFTGFTYGDVDIVPQYTEVLASDTDTRVQLAPGIVLHNPVLSAAMTTITETKMAVAVAEAGGLGVFHTAARPEEIAQMAVDAKYSSAWCNPKPIFARQEQSIAQFTEKNSRKGWDFRFYPVINEDGRLVGTINRDQIEHVWDRSGTQTVAEIMSHISAETSTSQTDDPDAAYSQMVANNLTALPVVDSEGKLTGLYTLKDLARRKQGTIASLDKLGRPLVGAAVETRLEYALPRVDAYKETVDVIFLDSSHGDSHKAIEALRELHNQFPNIPIIGGNSADGETALRYAQAGAAGVKVGVGAGSICTTRLVTAMGRGMITTIRDAHVTTRRGGYELPIIADGGIQHGGDMAKALAFGASAIMVGGFIAATDECAAKRTRNADGVEEMEYAGMGSIAEQAKASRARDYTTGSDDVLSEGVSSKLTSRGSVLPILRELRSGLKIALASSNAANIEEFWRKARPEWASAGTMLERNPHISARGTIESK